MFASSTAKGRDRRPELFEHAGRNARPVRVAFVTLPGVVFLGMTAVAAACIFGDCDRRSGLRPHETRVGHAGTVQSIAFRPDGAFASVGIDGSIVIWEQSGLFEHPFLPDGPGQVRAAAFSADNRLLATANLNEPVSLHDLAGRSSGILVDRSETTMAAACLAFAPDAAILAVGQQDGEISLWDAGTLSRQSNLVGHRDFVASLAFSRDGKTMASSAGDCTVRIWDVPARRERISIRSPERTYAAMAISPDGRILALADRVTSVVRLWDLTTGTEQTPLEGARAPVVAVAISPDGTNLAAADLQGFVTLWHLPTREVRPKRLKHSGVHTVAFNPDGSALATGGFDGTIQVWDFPIRGAE